MAAPTKKKRTRGILPTGTPRGWSFWETAEKCWRKMLLRYIMALQPLKISDPLIIGTIYHALLDNWAAESVAGWGPQYAEHIELGKRLYAARLEGPPLPKATASEKQHTLDFGMTSKPDREELSFGRVPVVRDFKSTMFFSETDDAAWNTNGGIIGEALAANAPKAIVDVICKQEGESFGRVQQFEIEITAAHKEALEQAVADLRSEISMRLDEALNVEKMQGSGAHAALRATFPKRLSSCVGRHGVCDYYERCWGKAPEKYLFEENTKRGHAWVKDESDAELSRKVEAVRKLFSKGVV